MLDIFKVFSFAYQTQDMRPNRGTCPPFARRLAIVRIQKCSKLTVVVSGSATSHSGWFVAWGIVLSMSGLVIKTQ